MQEKPRARVPSSARALIREAVDFLFPVACVGCGRYGGDTETREQGTRSTDGERWLCTRCREGLWPERPTCVACGKDSPRGVTHPRCSTHTPLREVVAVGRYGDPVLQAAIKHLKFHGARALAEPLGELLARRITAAGLTGHGQTAALIPLPLHPRRERWRGFNQARLLAVAAGRRLGLPVTDALVRTRATSPQTTILESPRVRQQNVAGAFSLAREFDPSLVSRALLVDDVLTTGASLTEAARVLAAAGVPEIWAAVVARG